MSRHVDLRNFCIEAHVGTAFGRRITKDVIELGMLDAEVMSALNECQRRVKGNTYREHKE